MWVSPKFHIQAIRAVPAACRRRRAGTCFFASRARPPPGRHLGPPSPARCTPSVRPHLSPVLSGVRANVNLRPRDMLSRRPAGAAGRPPIAYRRSRPVVIYAGPVGGRGEPERWHRSRWACAASVSLRPCSACSRRAVPTIGDHELMTGQPGFSQGVGVWPGHVDRRLGPLRHQPAARVEEAVAVASSGRGGRQKRREHPCSGDQASPVHEAPRGQHRRRPLLQDAARGTPGRVPPKGRKIPLTGGDRPVEPVRPPRWRPRVPRQAPLLPR
ncbi:hypothetical protein IWX58_000570 [Rubrivivax gelatinosus]|nr:hypothetical protein [Rubrivivax gelatinosus]